MEFWQIMNGSAWVLSGIIAGWLVYDFIRAERQIRDNNNKTNEG